MKNHVYLYILLICIPLNAQTILKKQVINSDSVFSTELIGETFIEFRGYNGNQYSCENWTESDILLSSGEMVYGKKLKYNGLLDEIVWLNTAIPGLYKLDRASITDLWFNNLKDKPVHFKRITLYEPPRVYKPDVFAEVAVEGKISLYIQRKISVLDEKTITKDGKLYPYKTIGPTPIYYLKLPTSHFLLVSGLNMKALLKLFPEHKKAIAKLVSENKLNLKSESDFIKLIELMNNEVLN